MMNISFSIFWNPVSFNFHTNFPTMKGARSEVSFFTRPSDQSLCTHVDACDQRHVDKMCSTACSASRHKEAVEKTARLRVEGEATPFIFVFHYSFFLFRFCFVNFTASTCVSLSAL